MFASFDRFDVTALREEMRRIFPLPGPQDSKKHREQRAENQRRQEAYLARLAAPARIG